MKMLRSTGFNLPLILLAVAALCVACKPREESPASPPPAAAAASAAEAASAPEPESGPRVISPFDAKNHIGEVMTVRGKVFGVHVTKKNDIFINVGGAHPNQPFTVVCFQEAIAAEDLKKLEGKTVSFTGLIKEHKGQVEIILERQEQISD